MNSKNDPPSSNKKRTLNEMSDTTMAAPCSATRTEQELLTRGEEHHNHHLSPACASLRAVAEVPPTPAPAPAFSNLFCGLFSASAYASPPNTWPSPYASSTSAYTSAPPAPPYSTSASASASKPSSSLKRSRFQDTEATQTQEGENTLDNNVDPSTRAGLTTYTANDVLCGRGGRINQHPGNCFFRSLVRDRREEYLRSSKRDKPYIALSIVHVIRERNGRFLKKDENLGLWFEIGDGPARDKASQALRRGGPEFQKKLHENNSLIGLEQHQTASNPPSSMYIQSEFCTSASNTAASSTLPSSALTNEFYTSVPRSVLPQLNLTNSATANSTAVLHELYNNTALTQAQLLRLERESEEASLHLLEENLRKIENLKKML